MEGEHREQWMQLCAEAAIEQDPKKLMRLIDQISRLLVAKKDRLNKKPPAKN